MNSNYLELTNLTKTYGNVVALNSINLVLNPGRIVGLLGPNGSGKTTLFKTIMRIIREQSGSVKICGFEGDYETRKYVSFMPDREYLYQYMNVKDEVK